MDFSQFLLERFFIIDHWDRMLDDGGVICFEFIVIPSKDTFVLSQEMNIR